MPENHRFGKDLPAPGGCLRGALRPTLQPSPWRNRVQNPHPLVVHFPLALLLVASLAALYAAWRQADPAYAFARTLLWLGTLACAAAVVTGFLAAQSVTRVRAAADTIATHQNLAYVLLGLA